MTRRRARAARRGFSMLEVEVAFVLLAIALAGLSPFVMAQLKQIRRIEDRLRPGVTHYLVPWTRVPGSRLATDAARRDAALHWSVKLTGDALVTTDDSFEQADTRPFEQVRVNLAMKRLRLVADAQAAYFAAHSELAADLDTLVAEELLDPEIPTLASPFAYSMVIPEAGKFIVVATRETCGGCRWSGTLGLNQDLATAGGVVDAQGGPDVVPGYLVTVLSVDAPVAGEAVTVTVQVEDATP